MKNDELIAAGHEMAKCLDNEPLVDIAKMIVRLADKLEVTTLALREKTKQCESMAVENAALIKSYKYDGLSPKYNETAMMEMKRPFIDELIYSSEYYSVCGHISAATNRAIKAVHGDYSWLPETPATEAFLREVRAQAITSALDSLDGVFDTDCVMETNGISYEEAEQRTTGALAVNSALIEFAAQLRQGGAAAGINLETGGEA